MANQSQKYFTGRAPTLFATTPPTGRPRDRVSPNLTSVPIPFPPVALGAEKGEAEVLPKKIWLVKGGVLGISGCLGFYLVPTQQCCYVKWQLEAVSAIPPAS